MGKNLIQQARGRGSPRYRSPGHRFYGAAKFPSQLPLGQKGLIVEIIKDPGHSAPLAKVSIQGKESLLIASESLREGESVSIGPNAEVKEGNIMELKDMPEGTLIHNIEVQPGDGGKFVRSSGTFGRILAKKDGKVVVMLPSKKTHDFLGKCRAAVGVVAGGGRLEKPFYKAGNKYHRMHARGKLYPKVSGVSMNAVDHPFGGSSSHHKGRPTQSDRNAPPGRKVGKIAPRRTGRRRG
ncbi:MAG TPA: 50S ribosomal protein L2 [Candidatus Nanoarchaeia archaeon]|nr:50S ribosomal protein L2 [Candidatus Nanoarchaeia archaeon]